jgi:hypothetical protein
MLREQTFNELCTTLYDHTEWANQNAQELGLVSTKNCDRYYENQDPDSEIDDVLATAEFARHLVRTGCTTTKKF